MYIKLRVPSTTTATEAANPSSQRSSSLEGMSKRILRSTSNEFLPSIMKYPKTQENSISPRSESTLESNPHSDFQSLEFTNKVNSPCRSPTIICPERTLDYQDDAVSVFSMDTGKFKDFQHTMDMICQSSMDPVMIIDERGRIKSVNNEMLTIFKYDLWEIAGKNVNILMQPEIRKNHNRFLERYRRTKVKRIIGQVRDNIYGVRKDGMIIPIKLKVNVIADSHGTVYIGMLKDVDRDSELLRIKSMISNAIPASLGKRLTSGKIVADRMNCASIMFVNIVDFNSIYSNNEPHVLVELLDGFFSLLNNVCTEMEVTKVKTIGDNFMAASGVLSITYDSAIRMVECALQMLEIVEKYTPFNVKIGIATGGVISGVLHSGGVNFDVWGKAVGNAKLLEESAPSGGILVCEKTFKYTKHMYKFKEAMCEDQEGKTPKHVPKSQKCHMYLQRNETDE